MKKILAILLALVMCLGFAACNNNGGETPAPVEGEGETEINAADLIDDAFIDPAGVNDDGTSTWAAYDALVAEIKACTDPAQRTQLMHDAEDILMSNYCVIPFYYYNDIYLQKDYVDGIYSNPFGTKFFMYSTLSNDADTLRINLASEPAYLDPALNSSVDGACLAANTFSGLYSYNAEGKTEPACAESYTMEEVTAEDGTLTYVYTVTLKAGLKWSDGSALTAKDFEYSWKRAAATATAADYGYMYNGFAGYPDELNVVATDDTTLTFVMVAPCLYIEDLMAFPTFFPVHQATVEASADPTAPGKWAQEAGFVSNGAYTCTGWTHDESMTYAKNPNWYDADKVTVENLQFMLSADDTAIYAAYNAGDIDFADTVPTDEIAALLDNPEFKIVDQLGTYYAAFNCKSTIFEGKTPEQAACMRKAFSILIDRDYICTNVGQTGQKPANAFIPYGMADGNGGVFKTSVEADQGYYDSMAIVNDYEATVEEARTLLKAAGFVFGEDGKLSADTPISITYLTNDGSGHIAVAEAMQQDLAAVGIDITINSCEWNVFLEERKAGNFDFAREGWIADFNDPINMLEMWTTVSGNNDCQYGRVGPVYEAMMAEQEAAAE